MSTLQTLDRGLRALEIVAATGGLSVPDLAEALGVARANCYRIVTTLAAHGLVHRGPDGLVRVAAAVTGLASRYWPSLLGRVEAVLQTLSDQTGACGHLSVAEGDSGVVVLVTYPRHPSGAVLGFPVGFRFPLLGAPGLALRAARPAAADDAPDVRAVRERGYVITEGQVQPGLTGVAVAMPRPVDRYVPEAAISLAAPVGYDVQAAVPLLLAARRALDEGPVAHA